ncbi:hypothetical protein D3P07_11460 [Paenibacillus sp. 1011MAR3C5]|uniref:hypothetical protein n=1 Tax=Paenibacillus sp. 1011MAR3C5 TaxID=1675787 RepID=UPI000E6B88CF|nr:hypothetical protein [Paenibacillus sp. 1011MAR3C5]RJE88605.1 hypothetical protein D3P07_11460 [Paenibacillus sp. 1011MAR3C5]
MSKNKAHASNGKQWVYTQKGCEHYDRTYKGDYIRRTPGQPVPEYHRKSCPALWTEQGWVEEGDVQDDK